MQARFGPRYGRDAGEARWRARARSKRDPGESHRPRCPCGAAREGRARGQPTPNSTSGAGSSGGVPHGHWRTAKICGRKEKGGGVSLAPSEPHAPPPRHGPAASSGGRLRLPGAAHVDPDPAVGVGPVRERRHEQPPLGAPAVRSERLRRGGRAESAMSVAQEGSRGERTAACLRRAHNVSELGELGEAAARHRGHGLDDVAHHAPRRPVPAVVLDGEGNEPPDREGEGVPGG